MPKVIDVHAHILNEDTMRLIAKEAPVVSERGCADGKVTGGRACAEGVCANAPNPSPTNTDPQGRCTNGRE